MTAQLADQALDGADVPKRVLPAIEHVLSGYALRNSSYRSLHDHEISQNLASRDLTALVNAGILEQHGVKRGAQYVLSEHLRRQALEARRRVREEIDVGADPYELLR